MTKQEELREEMIDQLGLIFPISRDITTKATVELLKALHSQGVVIKVDRELPPLISRDMYDKKEIEIAIKQARLMLRAGYVAVEPLIKEG